MVAGLCLGGFWFCAERARSSLLQKTASPPPAASVEVDKIPPVSPPILEPVVPVISPSVVIDAGHGGADGGTGANGLLEKDWTLKVALALSEELKKRGHLVELTRSADDTVLLADRPVLVNAVPRTAVISIHFNAGATDATGVETWYSWPKRPEVMAQLAMAKGLPMEAEQLDEEKNLADAIQSSLKDATGARDRGTKNREDLAITSRSLCPAVLIECGFLSNSGESKRIQDDSYRKKIVKGIANGYESWLLTRRASPVMPSSAPPIEVKSADAGAEH